MLDRARPATGFAGAVGNTPHIVLPKLSAALQRTIVGKAEFLNPGGSVKDRAARGIVEDAEARGTLRPGGTIVEGTAGNTGIALSLIANARGYRSIICVPDDQSPEKYALLRTNGADLRIVPAAPFTNPDNYYHAARRIAEETPGAVWADQFNNVANRRAHYATTGPEIWSAFGSEITAFVAACGTGGTLAGTATFLKERNPQVRTVLCDPFGSVLCSYVKTGELVATGESNIEGIGIKRITENFEGAPIDDALAVDDRSMVEMAYWLLREEGLFVGGSAALNVVGAARYARTLPKGARSSRSSATAGTATAPGSGTRRGSRRTATARFPPTSPSSGPRRTEVMNGGY
jgi:cysteine synthase A